MILGVFITLLMVSGLALANGVQGEVFWFIIFVIAAIGCIIFGAAK